MFAANIDTLLRGTLRVAMASDNTVGVEEASIQTLGLGQGFKSQGRTFFLSGVGYLNEIHPHALGFFRAPLPIKHFWRRIGDGWCSGTLAGAHPIFPRVWCRNCTSDELSSNR